MASQPLDRILNGRNVFLDANIFVYWLSGISSECRELLERCSREEVTGICLFDVVNEATHRLMIAEAFAKGLIKKDAPSEVKKHFRIIPSLISYWNDTQRILSLNLLFLENIESIVIGAQPERQAGCLLTTDSMIVSCMRYYGITALATADKDFEHVADIDVFGPKDLRA